jgi:hypothetical protein
MIWVEDKRLSGHLKNKPIYKDLITTKTSMMVFKTRKKRSESPSIFLAVPNNLDGALKILNF